MLQIADECRDQVDRLLQTVYRLCETPLSGTELAALYTAVRDIAGLAAICGLEDLGSAALSFCALIDGATQGRELSPEHVRVHLDVIRLLRRPDVVGAPERAALLRELDVMVVKLARKPAVGEQA